MIKKGKLKKAIEYVVFTKENLEELEAFVFPLIVNKTKKFNSRGRVSIQTPTGNLAFEEGDILIKFSNEMWLSMNRENFNSLFQSVE
ncbi:MAG: hypothetical protein E7F14_03905 [Enterococcus faecalis]|nr:hypothetical protein [Enterococcus faecalis]